MKFEIDEDTLKKINEWLKNEVYPFGINFQKYWPRFWFKNRNEYRESWELGIPYGSRIDYIFSYSSGIGYNLVVKESVTGLEKDFTDYENW